jgi:hypothetical protein
MINILLGSDTKEISMNVTDCYFSQIPMPPETSHKNGGKGDH